MDTPEDEKIWELVIKHKDAGDLATARDMMLKLIERNPSTVGFRNYLAHLYWRLGELDRAIDTFQAATLMAPKSERASLGLFHCLWERGQRDEALDEAKRFLTVAESEDYQEIIREINEREGKHDTNT